MNGFDQQKLQDLIDRFGKDISTDVRRCESLLRDIFPQNRLEVNLLVSAARHGVGRMLMSENHGLPTDVLLVQLAVGLEEEFGLAKEMARWSVETWSTALCLSTTVHNEAENSASTELDGSYVTNESSSQVEQADHKEQNVRSESDIDTQVFSVEELYYPYNIKRLHGEIIQVKGTFAGVHPIDASFQLSQSNTSIWVLFAQLPSKQKKLVLTEDHTNGRTIYAKGMLSCVHDTFELMAWSLKIKGRSARTSQPNNTSPRTPRGNDLRPCGSCRTVVRMNSEMEVCPTCGNRLTR